ncbi:MAG: endonuclease/exonuclease/phosphatase family protein [Proteobacteria bacterium]|nr:endonuclease/exonuclease/phosphatase family protein [Pseudomonadota bacterium]MBU1584806.1 endonuclease/exonuclease/phosphatase family protein [Pseudomonadota bacterium]MBU2629529.1 endonuclease/exonuclease/phosphatase family protein [Pseudomonadota bacterium]
MKKLIKIVFGVVCVLVLGFAGFLGFATVVDYRPDPTALVFEKKDAKPVLDQDTYRLMIWNIGYGGLSRDMDFFYDGGKKVRPEKHIVQENISAIETFISQQNDIDFFLLQEVDQHSKRSYSINEVLKIANSFPQFHTSFGKNYDVFFVPVPLLDPLGSVLSGLQTLSRFEPVSVVRHSFPGNFSWPQGLFMLDRCFLVSRYRLDKGKQLLIINTHNSAYDDGTLRNKQMTYLNNFLVKEYEKGNYVIVGGDWNQCPPGFDPDFDRNLMDNENRMDIEKDYLSKWQWAYDKKIPTNRRLIAPYDEKTTLTTVIDFFLVSPNIEIKEVHGIHLNFEHSDHHPVKLEIKLKG